MSEFKAKLGVVKRAIYALRSLSIILIISFILGELTFQLLKPNIPYQYAPQRIIQNFWEESPIVESTLKKSHESRFLMSAASFDSIVRTNSLGWRDDEPDGRNKVLVIGDSFTFGWGVNNNETIPYNLEEIYNNEYDFVNLGFTAGRSPDSYATYLRFYKDLQKIPTILMLYNNDWDDIKKNICVHADGSISKSPTTGCNKILGTETTIINGVRFLGKKPNTLSKLPISIIYWLKQSYMIASIRTLASLPKSTHSGELAAIESSKYLTEDDQDGLHGLLDEMFHFTGESLMIVSLNYSDEKGDDNKSFYGVVKKYCDLNNEIHCLNIPSLDITKIHGNDPHYNYLGTEYVANIIRDYMEDINFLK
jgi:hypothetical protein|tara:strand:+ start:286 stop:1380 length:1095 start_codon:yes stop_codon:yes gene_type:complete